MTKLRKAIVVSVMSMTVLSMSVVVAPSAGATAQAGDLIKMDGLSSVYFLAADGKRYVFPNEKTYFSWYSDFSGVVTIPQSELETYPLGANVTVRPGTKLVKITTDPKVYAVEPDGNLVHVPSEAVAQTLWGADWAKRVIDVPDGFFTNYTVTGDQVSATAYPTGSLVMFGDEATVYYIDAAGLARPISSEAAFLANRFKWDDIVKATIAKPSEGTAITAAEGDLTDTSSGAGGVANAGTGLTVALSGDTAGSANIPSCSTLVPWATYNFTAANDGAVVINNLILTRKGAGASTDFDGGYLYVGDERLSTRRSINSSDNTMTFTALNLSIPAGMTKAVTLKMNASGTGAACNTGVQGNHYFQITGAAHVETNGAVVSGSFPIAGNTLAYSTVQASDVTLTGSTAGGTFKIGETERTLSEFSIANGSEEVVNVYRIRLKQNGTANDDAIANFSLDLDGTIVAEGISMEDRYVDFILDNPYEVDKSKSITATVRGDIVDGIDKTIDLYANNVADFDVRGSAYGNNYSANIIITSFAIGNVTDVNITGSEIDVSFDGPAAQDIKDDTKDMVLANFKIKTNNLDVNIESVRIVLTMGAATAADDLDNIELVDSTNGVSYSVSDPTAADTSHNLDFENIYLQKGVQYNFEIRGDVPDAATTGQTYSVGIDFTDSTATFVARFQDDNETSVDEADVSSATLTGKTMTVASPSVTFSKVTTANASYVENTDGVLLYKGKITANSVDNLKVSKVKIARNSGGLATFGLAFEKFNLYKVNSDGTETLLDSETSLDSQTTVTFSGFTLDIPKGTSNGVYVVVRGDVKNNPSTGTLLLEWAAGGTSTSTTYTVRDSDNDSLGGTQYSIDFINAGQQSTIVGEGTFTMAIDTTLSGLNNNQNVLAGSEALLGRIKVTAANEEVTLEDFTLRNLGDATANDIAYVRIYAEKEMSTLLGEANITSGMAIFEDVNIEIPTTGITYLYIAGVAKLIDYSNSPTADATASAAKYTRWSIASTTGYTVKAVGVSTGEVLSNNNGVASTTATKDSTIYGAIPSDIDTSFPNGTLTDGARRKIFSFSVTAPNSSNVDFDGSELDLRLGTTTFAIATSGVQATVLEVEREGGAAGKLTAYSGAHANPLAGAGTSFAVNWRDTFKANMDDLDIAPGDTATFNVYATIAGAASSDSLQVYINDAFDSDFKFTHNTGTSGADGADVANNAGIDALITGITDVTGGTLTK